MINTENLTAAEKTKIYLDAAKPAKSRFKKIYLIEPLLIFSAIFAYFGMLGHIQQMDEKQRLAAAAADLNAKCQIQQNNTVNEFDCRVIRDQLAVINK